MQITSPAFSSNTAIPAKYSCDGANVNPALVFKDVPAGTKSLALIMDDPDAPGGTFVHWLVWNIAPDTAEIAENNVPAGASQGLNSANKTEYIAPCPPSGTHRYFFKLYALNSLLDLSAETNKAELEKAMEGKIIDKAQLIGLYKR